MIGRDTRTPPVKNTETLDNQLIKLFRNDVGGIRVDALQSTILIDQQSYGSCAK